MDTEGQRRRLLSGRVRFSENTFQRQTLICYSCFSGVANKTYTKGSYAFSTSLRAQIFFLVVYPIVVTSYTTYNQTCAILTVNFEVQLPPRKVFIASIKFSSSQDDFIRGLKIKRQIMDVFHNVIGHVPGLVESKNIIQETLVSLAQSAVTHIRYNRLILAFNLNHGFVIMTR